MQKYGPWHRPVTSYTTHFNRRFGFSTLRNSSALELLTYLAIGMIHSGIPCTSYSYRHMKSLGVQPLMIILTACLDCLSWLLVLTACLDCLSWLLVLTACLDCLSWLLVLTACLDCLSWLLVLTACLDCLSWLLVLTACLDCLSSLIPTGWAEKTLYLLKEKLELSPPKNYLSLMYSFGSQSITSLLIVS